MSFEMGVNVERDPSGVGAATSVVASTPASAVGDTVPAKKVKGKKKVADGGASSKQAAVERKYGGSVKMSLKLDRSAMARRIIEKRREAAKVKNKQVAAGAGEVRLVEDDERPEQTEAPK
ncbi:PhzF family phenazine biosynthesis protein [Sesbania bispinosa]|nr:PhzF family phenazine biosynthesis protein [Sesbania bispinosa]